jgi:hypothetical protein
LTYDSKIRLYAPISYKMEVFYGSNIFWPFIFVDPATSVPVSVQSLIALPQLEHHGPRMERKMGKRVRKRGKKKKAL